MSQITVANIQNPAGDGATQLYEGVAKAHCHFDGTGTIAIDISSNVSSLTDSGTGDYNINFTSAMSAADHSSVSTCASYHAFSDVFSTSLVRVRTANSTHAALDVADVMSITHGDLA